jgi:hypothetical protein
MPAAIGALLDIARRHPDIPASLLSETLSACSVESLGYLDAPSGEPAMMGGSSSANEPADLERLVSFEDLPVGEDDPELAEALAQIENADVKRARHDRAEALYVSGATGSAGVDINGCKRF